MADERVLTSFVLEDESLVDTWEVIGVGWGSSRVPPPIVKSDVVAVTDRRLMWFDDELEEIALADIDSVERNDYSHTTSPKIVRVGWGLFVVGVIASVVAFLFSGLDLFGAAMPAMTGLAVVLLTIVVVRARGDSGQEVNLQRITVETGDEPATLWREGDVEALVAAIDDGEIATEPETATDEPTETEADEPTEAEADADVDATESDPEEADAPEAAAEATESTAAADDATVDDE